ncbi:hypothetical protein DRJ16_02800 [Candidatus Woesearchaeota archaeon]|nr:MAG: hypothetical protein DRJ16_02800 [Candidatus Woesearchaeota archaeon]
MVVTVHYIGFHPSLILGGFEKIRIAYPIEKVYLLYDGKEDRYGKVSRYNLKRIERILAFFRPITLSVNPVSFHSVFTKIYAILKIETERSNRVFIDVTDMPPIATVASTVAVMMFKDVYIFSTHPETKGEFIPEPSSPLFEEWVERKDSVKASDIVIASLPRERLQPLKMEEDEHEVLPITILKILYNNKEAGSIKQLIEWCGYDPRRGHIKALFSRIVSSLEDKGFIVKRHGGKTRAVRLSRFGRAFIEALLEAENMSKRLVPQKKIEAVELF